MSRHMKQPQSASRGGAPWGIILAVAVAVLLVVFVAVGLLMTVSPAVQPTSQPSDSSTVPPTSGGAATLPTTGVSQPESEPPYVITPGNYTLPENMTGAWLRPGADYLKSASADAARDELRTALSTMAEWQFNTVFLPLLTEDGTPVWEVVEGYDPVADLRLLAAERGITVMAVWDMGVYSGRVDPCVPAERERAVEALQAATARYAFDVWLFDNPGYAYKDNGDETAYLVYGGSLSREAFLQKSTRTYYTECIKSVKDNNEDTAVGLMATAVWAHSRNDARGSRTYSAYEELTDGRADTLAWVQGGMADIVVVKNHNSTAHSSAAFSTTLAWWGKVCSEAETVMYVSHDASKVGSGMAGWTSPDQLSRQYLMCKRQKSWQGSAFFALADLLRDDGGSTAALRRAIRGDALSQYIGSKLELTSPAKPSVTTQESTFSFMGSADPNFPLTVNGEAVTLSELGQFSFDITLKPGNNTFTFAHKGETVTYTVYYDMQVLLSVAPDENIALDGGSVITLSAIARRGSKVTVTVGNTTLTMTASPLQGDEENGSNADLSDFENFAVSYTLPEGIIGKEQALGAFTVTATHSGITKVLKGGTLTVAALPEPPPPTEPDQPVTGDIPDVVGNLTLIDPGKGEGAVLSEGDIVYIAVDYAETFTGSTVDDYSRPINAYLPKGTTDIVVKTVYDSASKNTYYLLASGRRVYKSSAAAYITGGKLRENAVGDIKYTLTKQYTTLSLACDWRIPYALQLSPQQYQNASTTAKPNYNVAKYGYTAEYIDLTLYYTGAVPELPDVSGSPLFASAAWHSIDKEAHTATLRLQLSEKGLFYGYSVVWDNDGNLIFSFRNPADVRNNADDKPLAGLTIVVDPGHGGNSSGTYGTIPGLYEKTVALTYSLLVQEKLEALGATVIMSRTTDVNPSMNSRVDLARNNATDLLVSIHMNGVSGASASGCSVHYFNEYSYAVARAVTDSMREVEKVHETGNRSSPCAWSPFHMCRVHDCPSILVECGFMTNAHNMTLLVDPVYQEELTQAIVDGIVEYFRTRAVPDKATTPPATTTTTPSTSSTTAALPTTTETAAPTKETETQV